MDYRNDRDALRARVEELEQALDEARRGESVARVEAELVEADGLVRRLRGELAALQDPRAEEARAIEAEVAGAEARIRRLRKVLHEVQKAPAEAEALIQRLHSDLSGLQDARTDVGSDAPEPDPGPLPLRSLLGPSVKVGLALAGLLLLMLGSIVPMRCR